MVGRTKEERLASIETSQKNIAASIESINKRLDDHMDKMEKRVMWRDTCEEKHKAVDNELCHVKKKTKENSQDIKKCETDLDDHKKDAKEDSKYTVTTIVAIVALAVSIVVGVAAFVIGG